MFDTMLPTSAPWSRRKLFGFRVAFVFFTAALTVSWVYLAPPRVSASLESLRGALPAANEATGRWVMTHVLRLPPHSVLSGPGHPLAPVVLLGTLAAVSVLVAAIWSLLQSDVTDHRRLSAWLHALARYSLAATMLGYGYAKIWPVQFGESPFGPGLTQPVGEMTPYSLLWLLMGTSRQYTVFAGVLECLAGSLLLLRRTAGLGAVVALGALVNVGALDVAYGVPVLHVVTLLVLLAILVAAPYAPRVTAALLGSASIRATETIPLFANARLDVGARAAGMLIGAYLLIGHALHAQREVASRRAGVYPPVALSGVWQAEAARGAGNSSAAVKADTSTWQEFGFVFRDRALIRTSSGRTVFFDAMIDTTASSITFIRRRSPTVIDTLRYRYSLDTGGRLSLISQPDHGNAPMTLQRLGPTDFRLTATHYPWVW